MTIPKIEQILFDYLVKQRELEQRAPSLLADKLHANASSAGACARQIGYRVAKIPASNPITGDSLFNFAVGDAVHDQIQAAICNVLGAEKEVSGVIGDFITCRADLKYSAEDGKLICCEIKSVSDFAYKLATGAKLKSNGQWNKKDQKGDGPKPEHLLQVGISAKSIDAEYLCIVYARKTAAKGEPIIAEWRFTVNDFEQEIASEIARLKEIVELVETGRLPERHYQGETIYDPKAVKFPCGYCDHLTACIQAGAGIVPLPGYAAYECDGHNCPPRAHDHFPLNQQSEIK
jgi:hypothetical protein